MYALKPPSPQRSPQKPTRVARKARPKQQGSPYQAIAYETVAKLSVNVVLSLAAVSALVHLLPYRAAQETKVQELEAAVQSTSNRVQREREKFSYYFDPYQMRESMQELTDRIDPLRRRVVWQTPQPETAQTTPANPSQP